ncbi:UDP-2,3-diacylglucosamine diphosphatase [Puteibacter caeruleilacunae]|nr:UDP-2,3-diacylglucosamine diphosphatase [Puteibacter caeruleilacunae]
MADTKKIYFASDVHLGAPALRNNDERERLFVAWLNEIKHDASHVFLLGDIFDFWFEYKKVIPRGFTRTLGKLAELADSGIEIHFFTGNHDVWVFDYLPNEIGLTLHREPLVTTLCGKKFFLAHGDGLDKTDKGYLFLKRIFTSTTLQWLFARIHPNFAFWVGHEWSKKSRLSHLEDGEDYKGAENEGMVDFARDYLQSEHIDFFVTGHRHLVLDIELEKNSRFINTGDWINYFSYAVFDGERLELKKYNTTHTS